MKRKSVKIITVFLILMMVVFSSAGTAYASGCVSGGLNNSMEPMKIMPDPLILVNHMVQPIPESSMIPIHIYFKMSDPVGLHNYVESVSDPKSPKYHHFLTSDQLNLMFGPPDSVVSSVNSYFKTHGFAPNKAQKSTSHLEFTANVGTLDKIFQTKIKQVKINGKFMPTVTRAINVPTEVSSYIETIAGLIPHELKRPHSNSTSNLIKIPVSLQPAVIANSSSGDSLTITADSRFQGGTSAPTGQNLYLRIIAKDSNSNSISNANVSISASSAIPLYGGTFETSVNTTDTNGEYDMYLVAYQQGNATLTFSVPDSMGGMATNSIFLTWSGPDIIQTALTPNQINSTYDASDIVNNLSADKACVGNFGNTMPDPNVLATFEYYYGLAQANFISVPVDQTGNYPNQNDVDEADADIQRVESSAPGATIYFYADY